MKKILVLIGTRPEAIKMAPVILALKKKPAQARCYVCSTGQHLTMLQQVLSIFDIDIDYQMNAMKSNKNLAFLTSKLFKDIDKLLEDIKPDWVLVQGDTTSAYVGAMCAFYRKIRIGHVEAGLRTYDKWSPFPEEINRSFISLLADVHFAPTSLSEKNLKKELQIPAKIILTGNTVVDAIHIGKQKLKNIAAKDIQLFKPVKGKKRILVTCHRRESFGEGIANVCHALLSIAASNKDVEIIFPVHLNPKVNVPVLSLLEGIKNIRLVPPQPYMQMLYLINTSYLILSDSGGIQEEAPSFKVPLLVLRDTTERPEVLKEGCAVLVGTDTKKIISFTKRLLTDKVYYNKFIQSKNPFGDGKAAGRIVDYVLKN